MRPLRRLMAKLDVSQPDPTAKLQVQVVGRLAMSYGRTGRPILMPDDLWSANAR